MKTELWASKLCEEVNASYNGDQRLSGQMRKLIGDTGFKVRGRWVPARNDIRLTVVQ